MKTPDIHPYVVELLSSRMMHDLISPVGAINNGVELIEELGPDASDEAMDLIAKSANTARRRIRMFRYIYGAAGSRETVDQHDMRHAAFEFFEGARPVLEWSEQAFDLNQDLPQGMLKIILCLVMLGGEMITKAGLIKVTGNGMTPPTITVNITGEGSGFRDGMEAALDCTIESEDLDPRLIHAYISGIFSRAYGIKVDVNKDEEGDISFVISKA